MQRKLAINFIVVGTGPAQETARQQMKNAIFLGHVTYDILSKIYASSRVLVFPSISETYGNVVVEAMASGCIPVIARGGGSQTLVNDTVTGFLCEPNNAEQYVDKIQYVISKNQKVQEMQEAGYQYTSSLSWEHLAESYFCELANLLHCNNSSYKLFSFENRINHKIHIHPLSISI